MKGSELYRSKPKLQLMLNSTPDKLITCDLKKLRQLNILLVEDDLLNAKLISILFAQQHMKLQLAKNGMEAIEKIKAQHFDMILMDMEMPVMDGYQAVAIIRRQLKNNIPIIALTAHAQPGEKEKCLHWGMNDYMAKPINEGRLFKAIYNLTFRRKPDLKKTGLKKTSIPAIATGKVCNMGYLIGATRGNKHIINNIVTVFFTETRKELSTLDDAIKKINYPAISDISHKIKSAFSILGIAVLEPVFKEMEQLGSGTTGIQKIQLLNRRVNSVFIQAMKEMHQEVYSN